MPHMVAHTCSLSAWEGERNHKFKVSLDCITRYTINKKQCNSYKDIVFVQGLSLGEGLAAPTFMVFEVPKRKSSSAERESGPGTIRW